MPGKARKHHTVRELSAVEAAWLGAMIEGEGSLGLWNMGADGHRNPYPKVLAYNNEVETIATILRLVGDGIVHSSKRKGRRQCQWIWQLNRAAAIKRLLEQIAPYLTGKQDRAQEVIRRCDVLLI